MQFAYVILVVVAFFGVSQAADGNLTVCWREAYARNYATIPNYCEDGTEISQGACYPKCKEGFTGVGKVCWQSCPENYTDVGLLCVYPGDTYFPCPWYDVCGLTVAKGCLNCTKEGYSKDGCACRRPNKTIPKQSYGRGAGSPPKCKPPLVEDKGLCYENCKEDFVAVGPICWRNSSGDETHKVECNPVAFGETKGDCDELNALLKKAGITSPVCIGSLAVAIITHHVIGPKICHDLIEKILPTLANTPVC